MKTQRSWTLLILLSLALAGCGGADDTPGSVATGSYGTLTASGGGSASVNGVQFSTAGAAIVRDDVQVTEASLRPGMVVTVSGMRTGSSGSATRIEVDDAVKGFVEAKPDPNHWTILGQTVLVDDLTRFDNNIQPGIGEFAEVHGLVSGNGVIAAGFIERKTAPLPAFEVKGFVQNHNDGAKTFQIGALTVNYNGATINDMPNPATTSWNGRLVEAKGSTCTGTPPATPCGTLNASKVEPSGPQVQNAPEFEIEGFVTAVPPDVPSSSFKLGDKLVVFNGSTRFEGGLQSEIAVGVKLEVEGVIAGGVLTASKVKFKDSIKLEGDVAAIDVGNGSFTVAGLPGITVTVNNATEFDGVSALSQLLVGDHVEVRGRQGSGNSVIATEIKKRSPDSRVGLQGPIQSISGVSPSQIVTILGVAVNTTGVQFEDVDDNPISRAVFFDRAVVGTLVKARGDLGGGGAVNWKEMELED